MLKHLERVHLTFINTCHCTSIVKVTTVVRSRKYNSMKLSIRKMSQPSSTTVRKHLCLIRPKQITELSRVWNISRLLNVCNMFHGCQIMERNACIIFYHYCSSYVRHLKETENSFQSPTLKQQLDPS